MTDRELFTQVRALKLCIRKRDGEYRIAAPHGSDEWREATAYYTCDRDDALQTARFMAREFWTV
jgi:hypothetical protein